MDLQQENKLKDQEIAKTMNNPQDLGWANGWCKNGEYYEPEIVKKCRQENHERSDIDIGRPHRGTNHVIRCRICNYVYHVDSSD